MKIFAPVKDFNGFRNNVQFVNGVGETDNPKAIAWFQSHGYKVAITETPTFTTSVKPTETVEIDDEPELMGYSEHTPNFDKMTSDEIRTWAKDNGLGSLIKNTRNKDKLLELISHRG